MAATLTTLASFNDTDGENPQFGSLITDGAGDLIGTTENGGASGDGTVFEIPNTGSGYGALTDLVSFNNSDGASPQGGLVADAAGDLFGTTFGGGASSDGTVFEIPATGPGAGTLTTLVSFNSSDGANPFGTPLIDAAGDLFGTTNKGGPSNDGTVFEIPATGPDAGTLVTLSSFAVNNGNPQGSLIADAAGDLFGTTTQGGALGLGTVFEIPSTGSGGYGTLTTLGSPAGANGDLTTDAAGDLFGTSQSGGSGDGTVFEIPSTGSGGYGALTTLASFNGGGGGTDPVGPVIIDAAGDLFGTTKRGGGSNLGTVFEIAKTGSGYGAPTTLWSFSGLDGAQPLAGLNFDAAGNLFGTTNQAGGSTAPGTVFEITGSGFAIDHVAAGATATFTGGGSPVQLDPGVTVTDVSSTTLQSATISIDGSVTPDTLNFTNDGSTEGNIAVTSNVGGTLVLGSAGGTATLLQWQAALQSITYSWNINSSVLNDSRTVDWTINDGTSTSDIATSTLTTVHAAPTISAGGTVTFTGGGSAVQLDNPLVGLNDPDSGNKLFGATVKISSGFLTGDTLNFLDQNGIFGSYDATHGVLTLTGGASVGAYQTAIEGITYGFTAGGDPTGGGGDTSRTIDWQVNDGISASNIATSTLDTVHAAPTLTAGGTASFTGGGSAVTLDSGIGLTAPDSGGTLSSATISIASGFVAGDMLSFVNTSSATFGNIAVASNLINGTLTPSPAGGTLTLISAGGTATQTQWQNALASITYSFNPTNGDPTGGGTHTSRTIDWVVNDGVANSPQVTSTLTTSHTPPTVTAGATATFAGGGPAVTADAGLAIVAPDSAGLLTSASVSIFSGFIAGDTLNFANQNGITGSYNSATGVLSLSGTASVAAYQAALRSVTYGFNPADGDPTAGGAHASRTLDWTVGDGVDFSNDALSTLNVGHVAPSVLPANSLKYRIGDPPAVLGGPTVSDPDSSGMLTGATVQITGGTFAGDGDVLAATTTGSNILASYNAATETLTLSGTDTLSHYQSALDGITFASGPNPTNGGADPSRTVTWTLNDGNSANGVSTPVTSQIQIGDFNTALVQAPNGTVDFLAFQGTSLIQSDSLFSSWSIKAEGDFNHDGQTELVSQNPTTGQIDLLSINNNEGLQASELLQGDYWKVVGAGNFDGSGRTGIATQNTQTGQVDLLWFSGTQLTGSELLKQPLLPIVGAADFNGDGKTDLVGQTPNGQLDFLFFNGTQLTGSALTPQSYWQVHDVSNYGAVGNSQMVSQDPVSGQLDYLKFNGTSIVSTDLMQTPLAPFSGVPGSSLAANLFNVA